jgi:hypothetical protein
MHARASLLLLSLTIVGVTGATTRTAPPAYARAAAARDAADVERTLHASRPDAHQGRFVRAVRLGNASA